MILKISLNKLILKVFFNLQMFALYFRGACWSPVGRTGYETQNVSLGADCWHKGIVLHELLHSVGFWHEMNRPDRDAWIYIYWGNILQASLCVRDTLLLPGSRKTGSSTS